MRRRTNTTSAPPKNKNRYCAEIIKKMAELVNRDELDPALRENTAIAIGRLALTSPDTVAPLLDSFFPKWAVALCNIS